MSDDYDVLLAIQENVDAEKHRIWSEVMRSRASWVTGFPNATGIRLSELHKIIYGHYKHEDENE